VSVCCQKRGKKERRKENSMEGEDRERERSRRKEGIRV